MKRVVIGSLAGLLAALAWLAPTAPAAGGGGAVAYVTGTAQSSPSVWVAGAGGGPPRRLGTGTSAQLAPNGVTVAATDIGAHGPALTLYPTIVGSPKTYFNIATVTATAVAWSPDSRYLAVALTGNNAPSLSGYALTIIDTTTGSEHQVASGVIYGASFEPNGSDTLAYARARSLSPTAATNIFAVSPTGTGTRQLTTDGVSSNPVWGARGIAFDRARRRGRNAAPLNQIWLMSSAGSHARQVTHLRVAPLESGLVPLAFSGDGTKLAAEFEGEDTSMGYSVLVATGRATRLRAGKANVSAWGIARDGRSVLVSVGGLQAPPSRGKIEAIPFSGGRPTLLVAHGNYPSWDR
jgi:hypothetical protein